MNGPPGQIQGINIERQRQGEPAQPGIFGGGAACGSNAYSTDELTREIRRLESIIRDLRVRLRD